jgi:hypothetical protein
MLPFGKQVKLFSRAKSVLTNTMWMAIVVGLQRHHRDIPFARLAMCTGVRLVIARPTHNRVLPDAARAVAAVRPGCQEMWRKLVNRSGEGYS